MDLFPRPEVGILAGQDGWGKQTIDCIHSGAVEFLWVWKDAFQTHQLSQYVPEANRELSGDLNLHWWIIYLDDIVIFSKDLVSHLERPEAVLQKLEEAGRKLMPSKCELFQWQIAYLGHVISA